MNPYEILERSIVGAFGVCREAARRQLTHLQMVTDALTAYTLARAGFVGAIAIGEIAVLIAFHGHTP
jgi:hypothetical protein